MTTRPSTTGSTLQKSSCPISGTGPYGITPRESSNASESSGTRYATVRAAWFPCAGSVNSMSKKTADVSRLSRIGFPRFARSAGWESRPSNWKSPCSNWPKTREARRKTDGSSTSDGRSAQANGHEYWQPSPEKANKRLRKPALAAAKDGQAISDTPPLREEHA